MATFRTAKGVSYQRVGDEVVILDMNTGKYFGLNRTAAYVWLHLLEGTGSIEEYSTRFRANASQATADFERTRDDFLKRSLIVTA